VDRLISASSLTSLVEARARLARSELAALNERQAAITSDIEAASADQRAYLELIRRRGEMRDRLLRDGLRVLSLGGIGRSAFSAVEQDAIGEQLALADALRQRSDQLTRLAAELSATLESVAAKEAELSRLAARAKLLLGARDPGAAEVAVLRALADDAATAANAISELVGGAAAGAGTASWSWPITGVLTQKFGPSELGLEPAASYQGIVFPHFHDGIDVAAPLGSAVVAAAQGRVRYVGHLPDGAMVVVIAHDDGLVSLSAHLDDAFAAPPVRAGDLVRAGQVIGYVGMTGLTTGPHLHFSVHDVKGPVDPQAVLAAR
jgi:murein DD-endopeptidase MepM/ murein hydrolase activator NlpD